MPKTNPTSERLKLGAILVLSFAYCLVAVGVWMVQQGKTNVSADSVPSYPAPLFSDLYPHFTAAQQTCLRDTMHSEQLAALLASKQQPTNDQITVINGCLVAKVTQ